MQPVRSPDADEPEAYPPGEEAPVTRGRRVTLLYARSRSKLNRSGIAFCDTAPAVYANAGLRLRHFLDQLRDLLCLGARSASHLHLHQLGHVALDADLTRHERLHRGLLVLIHQHRLRDRERNHELGRRVGRVTLHHTSFVHAEGDVAAGAAGPLHVDLWILARRGHGRIDLGLNLLSRGKPTVRKKYLCHWNPPLGIGVRGDYRLTAQAVSSSAPPRGARSLRDRCTTEAATTSTRGCAAPRSAG